MDDMVCRPAAWTYFRKGLLVGAGAGIIGTLLVGWFMG